MSTWFETENYGDEIRRLDVVSETEKTLMVVGRWGGTKPARQMKDRHLHRTLAEAEAFLLERATKSVKDIEARLIHARDRLAKLQELQGKK